MALALNELHGDPCGVITPPRHLWWSGEPEVDLGDFGQVAVFYESVLDAGSAEEQAQWLNPGLLIELWPSLGMRPDQKAGWEALNRQLAGIEADDAVAAA